MRLIEDIPTLQNHLAPDWDRQQTVAFVPTMGNLHDGHLSLVRAAKVRADKVVVSIFVNPTQFAPHEDYDAYPRTLEADCKKLAQIGGVDSVFVPSVSSLYPLGCDVSIHYPVLETILCGASRPHFFSGVATVLTKFFNLIRPQFVFLGEKDFQQWVVVRQLVKALYFPIEVIGVPTVRESDGLAMSSRNQYLDSRERKLASQLYLHLKEIADHIKAHRMLDEHLLAQAKASLSQQSFVVDYIEVRKAHDLSAVKNNAPFTEAWVVLAAAFMGKTRLIDNIIIQ